MTVSTHVDGGAAVSLSLLSAHNRVYRTSQTLLPSSSTAGDAQPSTLGPLDFVLVSLLFSQSPIVPDRPLSQLLSLRCEFITSGARQSSFNRTLHLDDVPIADSPAAFVNSDDIGSSVGAAANRSNVLLDRRVLRGTPEMQLAQDLL